LLRVWPEIPARDPRVQTELPAIHIFCTLQTVAR
jgi:hypothetical protein